MFDFGNLDVKCDMSMFSWWVCSKHIVLLKGIL